ncbi:MAG: hypothetical protein R3346_02775 [Candidatus Spechtbacterales bacterium]|nr:hypothetical protein [Candidatus Spechtbacterales bacterium]
MTENTLNSSNFFETEEVTLNEAGFEGETSSAFEGEVISPISRPTGPKFGKDALSKIESDKFSGWGKKIKDFVQEKKYALVAVLGVVLFAAAGFWAATALHGTSLPLGLADLQKGVAVEEGASVTTPTFDNVSLTTQGSSQVASSTSEITLAAETGEGVTHVARKAVTQQMEKAGLSLSAEQRIYAEDFLKDQVGATTLTLGQEVTFSAEDINAAIAAAQGLSEAELQNLTQYTQNVSF